MTRNRSSGGSRFNLARWSVTPTLVWTALFFAAPLAFMLMVSTWTRGRGRLDATWGLHNYEKIFSKSYLLDGRNIQWGLSADMDQETYFSGGEALRRFGEVAKLFMDAGHVLISTTNIFNQDDHSNITLLVQPSPVIDVQITDDTFPKGKPEVVLTVAEAADHDKAIQKIIDYLKEQKILIGQNYSI